MAELPLTHRAVVWTILSQGAVLLPHALHLPFWLPLLWLALALRVWRGSRLARPLPGRWLRLALIVVVSLAVVVEYRTLLGRDAGVSLLAGMMALKLVELRTRRDGMLVLFLGYFLVVTNFLYSQSPLMALYMFAVVLSLTAAMSVLTHAPRDPLARDRLRLAFMMLAQSVPIMVVLFLLFPRLPGPLWSLPRDAYAGMSGLSDTMEPGLISNLGLSGAVAFRVDFVGDPPAGSLTYWRGPVFWHFDGRRWSAGEAAGRETVGIEFIGEPVDYAVTLEPHNRRWLFALDMADGPVGFGGLGGDYQMVAKRPVRERLRYEARSYPHYRLEPELSPEHLLGGLQLPRGGNERARALAREWRAAAQDDGAVVNRALRLFREEPFVYTLTPPPLGEERVDSFLFETRRGFCEHYAGAFVFLMRAAGIPARVVTGYQGGELNAVGGYLIVRQSDAHAWAEVWLEEEGWVRVDPTAAVSPARVEAGLAAALPEGEPVPFLARQDAGWLRNAALRWDAVNNFWNQWVLGYGAETQYELLRRFVPFLSSARYMIVAMVVGVALLLLGVSLLLFLPERGSRDPLVRAYRRFCTKLAAVGIVRGPHEGPLDFARRAAGARPDLAATINLVSRLYAELRYGRREVRDGLRRLRRMVRGFHP